MEKLKAKLKKQDGFTMVELLIVVAIIAILVAVSIPMMNSALEKSRHAVDQANVRDALALAMVEYLTDSDNEDYEDANGVVYTYYVDKNSQGALYGADETPDTGMVAVTPKCQCADNASGNLTVTVKVTNGKPTYTTSWHFNGTKTVAGDANTPPAPDPGD